MSNVLHLNPTAVLRLKLVKAANTLHDLAGEVKDPAKRAKLTLKARAIQARAKELV